MGRVWTLSYHYVGEGKVERVGVVERGLERIAYSSRRNI
jgi:hypothetical protein